MYQIYSIAIVKGAKKLLKFGEAISSRKQAFNRAKELNDKFGKVGEFVVIKS